jgi:hypothetical protein
MKTYLSDQYSDPMAACIAAELRKLPSEELLALVPAMAHRKGNGRTLLLQELKSRTTKPTTTMTDEQKAEITNIAQEFAKPFEDTIGPIAGSGWLIVDPLSGYLNAIGFQHKLSQMEPTAAHPQVLFLEFPDGSKFVPAGSDLKSLHEAFCDWLWI